MTRPRPEAPATAKITIGVRRYHAATGTYTTIRAPREFTPTGFDPLDIRFPPCACPRCRPRRAVP